MKFGLFRRDAAEDAVIAPPIKPVELSGDPRHVIRAGLLFLIVGFGGFLLWAALAPLDEGVPAPGVVAIYSQRKPVQHPTGGVVGKVFVKEAQTVKAGDVLIELDATQTEAVFNASRKQWLSLRAQEARLNAERLGAAAVKFPDDLATLRDKDPVAAEFMTLQSQLFATRRSALQSELGGIGDALAALDAQNSGLRGQLEGRLAQLDLVNKQLAESRKLANEGYLPRNKLYEEERLSVELNSQVNDVRANLVRILSNISELKQRREQRRSEFLRDVDTQLADVKRDLEGVIERLRSSAVELERTRIRAPVDGTLVGLQVQSVGAVIPPGGRIADIVPRDEQLILEVHVPPHLVDRVQGGMPADLRFHSFVDTPNLVLEGKVLSVSADRLVEPNSQSSYYLGRVAVLPESMKRLEGRELTPGMPAEVMIKTGERSMLNYLIAPLRRRVTQSMTEH